MSRLTLILRSLAFHWRAHLASSLAAAIGTAVLVGALLVGDSVRYSLKTMAVERLGRVKNAILGGDRFFRADLARDLNDEESSASGLMESPYYRPMILLGGTCNDDTRKTRAPSVQVVGVADTSLLATDPSERPFPEIGKGEAVINQRLAEVLNAQRGDVLRLRIIKPGLVASESLLASSDKRAAVLRATVAAVIPDRGPGRFGFAANQAVPLNVFLPLADVQEKIGQKGRANVLLAYGMLRYASETVGARGLARCWTLDDVQLRLRADPKLGFVELTTPRVFLDDAVCDALAKQDHTSVLTYFVNAIRANGKETPYSMVTAAEAPLVPNDLKDDEVVLNEWTADDLGAQPGDKVELEYFTLGLLSRLETHKAAFTVKAIVPLAGLHADRNLMPEFPGIADVDTTHDWDAGIPIDMRKIRPKDEQYWKDHRGTPKAFIALKKGVGLWRSRFGTYTALRFPLKGEPEATKAGETPAVQTAKADLDKRIRSAIDPASVGLKFTPVRELALRACEQGTDFGGLFLGLSFFLIVAALLLMALMFRFNVESRASETGLLLALGFRPRAVRGLLWAEGTVMAALGSVLGVAGGTLFAQALLAALTTRWRDAVGTSSLEYHAEPLSLAIGYVAGVAAASAAVFFAVRRQAALTARELLASTGLEEPPARKPWLRGWYYLGGGAFVAAVAIIVVTMARGETSPLAFFGAGALLLLSGLAGLRSVFADRPVGQTFLSAERDEQARMPVLLCPSLSQLGRRGAARRSGRSVATATLLACGTFLIVAIGANQQDATRGAERKESGTGGFALVARSTLPVFDDLNTAAGRAKAGVADEGFAGVTIYPLRVKDGDEASCLNLNRAQQPRILGVPESFRKRGGFTFAAAAGGRQASWEALLAPSPATIAGVCDYQSLTWALGKKVGDTIAVSDENGVQRQIRIVGAVANSVLQGSILISEEDFLTLYPAEGGYREFLIDTPRERADDVAKLLGAALQDEGFDAVPAARRLAEFNAVANTYLATFQALGVLGLLLGSLGLGIVVLRTMLERRSELAILQAIGFSHQAIGWLVLSEHAWLLLLGLGAGLVAALAAVAPVLTAASAPMPWPVIALALAAVVACGLGSAALATWAMLRAPLLPALRNE